ncbi:MAG: site-specific integrase [Lachnospiraceae bacterium]|jgi:integrase|nr:site-specific integrase [Lachnospiraceae bacterium]
METKENRITNVVQQLTAPKMFKGTKRKFLKFEHLAFQWLKNVKLRIKESSYVKYHNMVQNHMIPDLGEWQMEQLTTEVVEHFVQKKLTCGKRDGKGGLSEKTVKDILAILKEICLYAVGLGIEVPCRFELIKIRRRDMEVQVLDGQNYMELVRYLLRDNSPRKTGILLSLYMGLRLGEVCALKRQHILYKEEILCIRSTMQRIQNLDGEGKRKTKIIVTDPKSNSSVRDIPIPPFLMERLEGLKSLPEDAYLLTGSAERFIEPRTLEYTLKRYLQDCKMEHVNYHALRHTFATRCMEEGFDVKSLSEILGHSNVNITLNRYVHSSMEQKRKNMGKILPYREEFVS